MNKEIIICPFCNTNKVIKWGLRKTQNRGKIQRYKCKSCFETFIIDSFQRMRNTPEKITCALDLFYRGLSTRDVQSHFKSFFPHNSDHSTILRWITKYSLQISNYTDKLDIKVGDNIEVDEMEYFRRKSHKTHGVDRNWFIDSIDIQIRFMISSKFAQQRSMKSLKEVLKLAKTKTNEQVKIVTTDGLMGYPRALRNSFNLSKHPNKTKIIHKVRNASKGQGFNIYVERMHNTIRQRTKTFRGLHGSLDSAYCIFKGIEIHYNFIRKHESLKGKTPSDLAIPNLEFNTKNRWLELIILSSI